jgi:hypothetical protein
MILTSVALTSLLNLNRFIIATAITLSSRILIRAS